MKRVLMFTFLFAKRLLKKLSFVLILLLMPVLVLSMKLLITEDSDILKVALLDESGDEEVARIIENLENGGGAIVYYEVDSMEELKVDVLKNSAECGVVFTEGLYDKLVNEDADDAIVIYKSLKTTMEDIAKEEIYVEVYRAYAEDLMKKFLEDQNFYEDISDEEKQEMYEYMDEDYAKFVDDGGAFDVIYNDDESGEVVQSTVEELANDDDHLMRPIKGILALFVMMAALAGAVFKNIDEKNGVYATMGYAKRPYINALVIFIPTLMAAIVGVVSKYLAGMGRNLLLELGSMFAYVIILTGFAYLLTAITRSAVLICSMLPMFTIVSMLGCNMFVDVASKIVGVNKLRIILPPNYYLEIAKTPGGALLTLGIGVALIAIGVVIDRRKMR